MAEAMNRIVAADTRAPRLTCAICREVEEGEGIAVHLPDIGVLCPVCFLLFDKICREIRGDLILREQVSSDYHLAIAAFSLLQMRHDVPEGTDVSCRN